MLKDLTDIYKYCEGDISKIENFDKAILDRSDLNTHSNWVCHHRLETHNLDGTRREQQLGRDDLMALDLYYHRPPSELIFLTKEEHNRVHTEGRRLSEAQVDFMKKRTQVPVRCIELDKVFSSLGEAAKYFNKSVSGLSNHLRRGGHAGKTYAGYHWEYALSDEELTKVREEIHYVSQYYERSDGITKSAFDWKKDGFLQTSICNAIHKNKLYKGFYWSAKSYE